MPLEDKPVTLLPGEGVIRCPAIRSLVKAGCLSHENLQTAAVQELVAVLSGEDHPLPPNEPGSLANVAGFFAIFNHDVTGQSRGFVDRVRDLFTESGFRRNRDAAAVAAGLTTTDRRFNLELFESPGDHPGTVNFFKSDKAGEFQPDQFASVMSEVGDSQMLTIQGIAKMIVLANEGRWDKEGSILDLAKSSGEWALMVCVLRTDKSTTDLSIADLHQMYSQADPAKLLKGARRATVLEWIDMTARIAAAIAKEKGQALFFLGSALHARFKDMNPGNGARLCPCHMCNPQVWST